MPRLIKSVTITDEEIWIDGERITDKWYIHEEGPEIEWIDEAGDFKVGVLMIPYVIFSDQTVISDLRTKEEGTS